MARIEGKVDSISLDQDNNGSCCRIHLHSQGLCYDAVVNDTPGEVLYLLLKKGDRVALHGPVSLSGLSHDIDVSHIEMLMSGKMQKLAIGYTACYSPFRMDMELKSKNGKEA